MELGVLIVVLVIVVFFLYGKQPSIKFGGPFRKIARQNRTDREAREQEKNESGRNE